MHWAEVTMCVSRRLEPYWWFQLSSVFGEQVEERVVAAPAGDRAVIVENVDGELTHWFPAHVYDSFGSFR